MIAFTKMQGLGNDFMVIDALNQAVELTPLLIQAWANRYTGVGFDQLMLLTKPFTKDSDFGYRIFNADGQEVEQCGNGVRCIAQFIHDKKLSEKKKLRLSTAFGTMIGELEGTGQVRVNMGRAVFDPAALPFQTEHQAAYYELPYHDRMLSFGAVSVGNPHIVFEVPDSAQAEVAYLGSFFNTHTAFPKGVNVGFMEIIDPTHIRLRVFERGAGETQACGTGACAAVSVGQLWQRLGQKVEVTLPGGCLWIERAADDALFMTGPAITVFEGLITL